MVNRKLHLLHEIFSLSFVMHTYVKTSKGIELIVQVTNKISIYLAHNIGIYLQ